jgi:hypothetical protein
MSEPTLVERLRFDKRHGANHVATCLEAADRIEKLEGELLRETKLSLKQYKQVQDLLNEKTQLNVECDAWEDSANYHKSNEYRLNQVLDNHIKLLLRLSAFDAPEAKTLAASLQLEKDNSGESDE